MVQEAKKNACRAAERPGQFADVAGADIPGPGFARHNERQILRPDLFGEQAHLRIPGNQRRRHPVGRHRGAAVTEAGTGRPRAASPRPTAAPNSGPSSTFCGRIPSRPPRVPVAAPTATGPAPVTRPAAHPSGATSAALVPIRAHNGGISPGRCQARATASQAPSAAAPATAPTLAARAPR